MASRACAPPEQSPSPTRVAFPFARPPSSRPPCSRHTTPPPMHLLTRHAEACRLSWPPLGDAHRPFRVVRASTLPTASSHQSIQPNVARAGVTPSATPFTSHATACATHHSQPLPLRNPAFRANGRPQAFLLLLCSVRAVRVMALCHVVARTTTERAPSVNRCRLCPLCLRSTYVCTSLSCSETKRTTVTKTSNALAVGANGSVHLPTQL